MNRILFDKSEIVDGVATLSDARAAHILDVLHGETGQKLKTGELDGPIGEGEIVSIEGRRVTVRLVHDRESLKPWVDLILAPPRPRALKRLLPQLASLGVGRIVLVGAKKVEKDFWGATLLKPEIHRPLFIEGLMQAGVSIMPELVIRRNFRAFMRDEMETMFASSRRRLVAHPYGAAPDALCSHPQTECGRTLLAIGPEGGWLDEEVSLFESHSFARFSLGGRILRTDTALVAALALAGACNL